MYLHLKTDHNVKSQPYCLTINNFLIAVVPTLNGYVETGLHQFANINFEIVWYFLLFYFKKIFKGLKKLLLPIQNGSDFGIKYSL